MLLLVYVSLVPYWLHGMTDTVSFSVGANGNAPLSYQWWFNVTNQLNAATNGTFIITNAQAGSAGSYSVIVSNPFGTATSSVAGASVSVTSAAREPSCSA